jgi:hypothetical protein
LILRSIQQFSNGKSFQKLTVSVADKGVGSCMDPEGNGVNPGEGDGGGPGPPSGEQDKQLISSRGGGNTHMEQPGRLEDESGVTTRTHRAQST